MKATATERPPLRAQSPDDLRHLGPVEEVEEERMVIHPIKGTVWTVVPAWLRNTYNNALVRYKESKTLKSLLKYSCRALKSVSDPNKFPFLPLLTHAYCILPAIETTGTFLSRKTMAKVISHIVLTQ